MTHPRRRALDQPIRPTRAEVDLLALRANLESARRIAGSAEILAVVKANAYGHGAVAVAQTLESAGVAFLGVALVEEAVELRNAGVRAPILVMGGSYSGGYEVMVELDLTPFVFREDHLVELARAARAGGKQVRAHLKVDTGMGRIGVLPDALEPLLSRASQTPEVQLEGLASHFASADVADAELTRAQVDRYRDALARMEASGLSPKWRHISNSAGLIDHPESRAGLSLNLARPGLMLYGLAPAHWLSSRASLQPVLSWKTAAVHVKRVPAGTPVSYGSTWRTSRESSIATVPVGYADGYPRSLSNRASVLVRGSRAPVVGRVCMDMLMVDVTDVPGAAVGDEVVLIGQQGSERISAHELASLQGTIAYEVLCAVGARVPRIALGE